MQVESLPFSKEQIIGEGDSISGNFTFPEAQQNPVIVLEVINSSLKNNAEQNSHLLLRSPHECFEDLYFESIRNEL